MIIIRCPNPLQIRTTKTTVTSWWTDRWISVGTPQSNFSLSTNENEKNLHFSHFLHRDSYSSRIRFLSGANNGITGLEIKWNFTLYSYQLKRPVEAKKSRDFIDHYGEKRVAFLHFRCVDIASSSNDKKSFVHSLELLPRRHLYAQRAKQLDLLWSNSNARGARVIQRARLCFGRLSD